MAKASDQLTVFYVVDVKACYRYYLLKDSTTDKPSKPTTYPPPSTWSSTEPTYKSGSTKKLYFVDCIIFNNNTFVYSDVSLSSSYETSKSAYTKGTGTLRLQVGKSPYSYNTYTLSSVERRKHKCQ